MLVLIRALMLLLIIGVSDSSLCFHEAACNYELKDKYIPSLCTELVRDDLYGFASKEAYNLFQSSSVFVPLKECIEPQWILVKQKQDNQYIYELYTDPGDCKGLTYALIREDEKVYCFQEINNVSSSVLNDCGNEIPPNIWFYFFASYTSLGIPFRYAYFSDGANVAWRRSINGDYQTDEYIKTDCPQYISILSLLEE